MYFFSFSYFHGLINYKDTKTKCRLYWCLIRVYRLEIQSVKFVVSTPLCELNLLWFTSPTPPPLPKVKVQRTVYTDSVWLGGGEGCWVVLETIFCKSLTLCFWPGSETTKLLHHPKQKPRRGGGLRQINTCRKVSTFLPCSVLVTKKNICTRFVSLSFVVERFLLLNLRYSYRGVKTMDCKSHKVYIKNIHFMCILLKHKFKGKEIWLAVLPCWWHYTVRHCDF